VAWLLVAFVRKPLVCLGGLVGITAGYLVTGAVALRQRGIHSAHRPGAVRAGPQRIVFPRIRILPRAAGEELRTRRTLERYVSKNLVAEILENPDSYYSSLRGMRVPVTILFSDLIGFTTLAEESRPPKRWSLSSMNISHG